LQITDTKMAIVGRLFVLPPGRASGISAFYGIKRITMSRKVQAGLPPHMKYEYVKVLSQKQPNPPLLARYLLDIVRDDEAFASAVNSMVRIPVGFHSLYVSRRPRLQLNFYRDDITGNEDPHGHARWARTAWYAPPGSVQKIVRHQALPPGVRKMRGLPIRELQVMPNNVIDTVGGGRPIYGLASLGRVLILECSQTRKMALSGEDFMPWEVHNAKVHRMGDGRVAVSTHYKGREEPASLSTRDGLVGYKHLRPDDADQLLAIRGELRGQIGRGDIADAVRLGPATMIYVPFGRDPTTMDPMPQMASPELAEQLILGGLQTAQELARHRA
jgi:hypothetical protein